MTTASSRGEGSGKSAYTGGWPPASTTAAFMSASKVCQEMVFTETICPPTRVDGKMVSVKTKADLVDEINALIGAVGDKFDAEEGDPERDYMAAHCPKRLQAITPRWPT